MKSGLEIAGVGQPPSTLANSRRLAIPKFAGSGLVAFDEARNTLDLLGGDGTRSRLGPPSLIRTDVDADADGVAWLFNGCLRYAPLTRDVEPKAHGPCPGSELALWAIGPSSKLRGNTARVSVKCVTSIAGHCKGRLVARSDYGKPIIGRGTTTRKVRTPPAWANHAVPRGTPGVRPLLTNLLGTRLRSRHGTAKLSADHLQLAVGFRRPRQAAPRTRTERRPEGPARC
jgi:hypothetical protein